LASTATPLSSLSFLCFLFLPLFPSPKNPRAPGIVHRLQRLGGGDGGAAAGPLAGERVPHTGERATVEGMHGGALGPNPHGGEAPTSPSSPLSARVRAQGGTGGGRDGEVGAHR
jgi:hypothetical protein